MSACIDSPINMTMSGEEAHMDRLNSLLEAQNIVCHEFLVGVACHYF